MQKFSRRYEWNLLEQYPLKSHSNHTALTSAGGQRQSWLRSSWHHAAGISSALVWPGTHGDVGARLRGQGTPGAVGCSREPQRCHARAALRGRRLPEAKGSAGHGHTTWQSSCRARWLLGGGEREEHRSPVGRQRPGPRVPVPLGVGGPSMTEITNQKGLSPPAPSPGVTSDGGEAARAPVLCARGLDKLRGSAYATPIPVRPQARPLWHTRTLSRASWTPTLRAVEPQLGWGLQCGRHARLAGKRPTRLLPTLQGPRHLHGQGTGPGEPRPPGESDTGCVLPPPASCGPAVDTGSCESLGHPGRKGSESPTSPGPRRYAGPPGAGAGTEKQTGLRGQAALSTGHQDSEDAQA